MSRRRVARHAACSFLVSALVLAVGSGVGMAIFNAYSPEIHYVSTLENPVRVVGDGAILALLIGFPVPFLLATLSTAYSVRVTDREGE